MVGSVKVIYFCNSDVSAIQGHPRSLILVPIESAYMRLAISPSINLRTIFLRFGDIASFWFPLRQIADVGVNLSRLLKLFGRAWHV